MEVSPPGRTRAALRSSAVPPPSSYLASSGPSVLTAARLREVSLASSSSSGVGRVLGETIAETVARSPPPSAVNWEGATPQQRREAGRAVRLAQIRASREAGAPLQGEKLVAVTAAAIARVTAAMTGTTAASSSSPISAEAERATAALSREVATSATASVEMTTEVTMTSAMTSATAAKATSLASEGEGEAAATLAAKAPSFAAAEVAAASADEAATLAAQQ